MHRANCVVDAQCQLDEHRNARLGVAWIHPIVSRKVDPLTAPFSLEELEVGRCGEFRGTYAGMDLPFPFRQLALEVRAQSVILRTWKWP